MASSELWCVTCRALPRVRGPLLALLLTIVGGELAFVERAWAGAGPESQVADVGASAPAEPSRPDGEVALAMAQTDAAEEQDAPLFLELSVGVRSGPVERNSYFGSFMSHAPTEVEDTPAVVCGDFGIKVAVPLFPWLEVGGGVQALYTSWDAGPYSSAEYEAVGVELLGHVRAYLWFMDNPGTHRPGASGLDGGLFAEFALGPQIPFVIAGDRTDVDGAFVLRPMGGMIYRFGPDVHWLLGGGYGAAFAHRGWDGNDSPALSGGFGETAVGFNVR